MRPDFELPEWLSPPEGPTIQCGPSLSREAIDPRRLTSAAMARLRKMFGTDVDRGRAEKVAKLTRRALATGRPVLRFRAAECNADHPGRHGYEVGSCRGCKCPILLNPRLRESAPEDAIIAYLCGPCFDISREINSPDPPRARAIY